MQAVNQSRIGAKWLRQDHVLVIDRVKKCLSMRDSPVFYLVCVLQPV
jgi:hypothetical protein